MQIFIPLYIEAGSYINEEEDGWEFVVLLVTCSFSQRTGRSSPYLQVRKAEAEGWNRDVPFCWLFLVVQLLLFPRKSAVTIEVGEHSCRTCRT